MMKKILGLVALFAAALLVGADATMAHHSGSFGPVEPRTPVYDGFVRTGGFAPSMSFYMTGLRGGVVTHPRQDFRLRTAFSSYNYPRENIYYGRNARVGGRFHNGFFGLRGIRTGDFVFTGGNRLAGGSIIS